VLLLGRSGETFAEDLRSRTTRAAHRITAIGGVPSATVSVHLQACDLLVQPYIDGVSSRRGTMMAALAHGIPTVTTTGRLTERLWQSSGAARLIAAGDLEALLDAVVELAGDPAARERYASSARALYDNHFDLSRTVRALRSDACQVCDTA
jgi:glycosyltransferase involved in cell wall biosynthesis